MRQDLVGTNFMTFISFHLNTVCFILWPVFLHSGDFFSCVLLIVYDCF